MGKERQTIRLILLCLCIFFALEWRIDHKRADNMQTVVDLCVFKGGFIVETAESFAHPRRVYGIVCGRAEEFNNSDIIQPYTVWPVWRFQ